MNVIEKYKTALGLFDLKFHVDVVEVDMDSEYVDMGRMFSFSDPFKSIEGEWSLKGELYFNPFHETEWQTPRALYRYKPFFDAYEFEYTPENVDSFVVLHEIGHLVLNEILLKNKLYDRAFQLNGNMIDVLEPHHFDEDGEGPYMPLVLSAMEQWCDNFAMINFKRLYVALGKESV